MKQIKITATLLLLIALMFSFNACGDNENSSDENNPNENNNGNTELILSSESELLFNNGINFTFETGEQILSFSCNKDWNITIAKPINEDVWCTASSINGKAGNHTIKINVTENSNYDDRSVSLTIKVGNIEKNVLITQKQKDAILLTSNRFDVDKTGGKINVEVKSNIDYTIEIPEANKDWIKQVTTKALTTNSLSFEIAPSEEADKREGVIYFVSGNIKETIKVYQTGGEILLLTKNDYSVSSDGETITVEIKSNFDYGVKMPNIDWIKNAPSAKAASSHTLYYVISPNETYENRSAEIIYYSEKNKSITDTLKITQKQNDATIILNKEYIVTPKKNTLSIPIETNCEYDVKIEESASSWISLSKTKSLKTDFINIDIMENNDDDYSGRKGIINVINKISNDRISLTIIQKSYTYEYVHLSINKDNIKSIGEIGYKYIRGNVTISADINSLEELNNTIENIGGDLIIKGSCSITTFKGLGNLKEIKGSLLLTGEETCFENLESFQGLNNLESIGANLSLTVGIGMAHKANGFNSLKSFAGFDKLRYIGGNFSLFSGSFESQTYSLSSRSFNSLVSLNGLESLNTIGRNINIWSKARFRLKDNRYQDGYGPWQNWTYSFEKLESLKFANLKNFTGSMQTEGIPVNIEIGN